MGGGNTRDRSLNHSSTDWPSLIVSSSPSQVQELYEDGAYEDDEMILITPQQLLNKNDCSKNENYRLNRAFKVPVLPPRRSNKSVSHENSLSRNSFPRHRDVIFSSSDINDLSCDSESYLYYTPKIDGYANIPSPPPVVQFGEEGFEQNFCRNS